jgi:hypothetical protein
MESDHESIGSKVSTGRSKAEFFAVKHLASFFAQLEDLRSLNEVALQIIERRRFTENYRRIFKSYNRRLLCEAANDTEKDVTKILRSRQNRESIAEGIADYLQHVEEEESRSLVKLVAQPTEKRYLDNWLRRTQGLYYSITHILFCVASIVPLRPLFFRFFLSLIFFSLIDRCFYVPLFYLGLTRLSLLTRTVLLLFESFNDFVPHRWCLQPWTLSFLFDGLYHIYIISLVDRFT